MKQQSGSLFLGILLLFLGAGLVFLGLVVSVGNSGAGIAVVVGGVVFFLLGLGLSMAYAVS